jgi:hypothetical protein
MNSILAREIFFCTFSKCKVVQALKKYCVMETYVGNGRKIPYILYLGTGDERLVSRPCRFTPGKDPSVHFEWIDGH